MATVKRLSLSHYLRHLILVSILSLPHTDWSPQEETYVRHSDTRLFLAKHCKIVRTNLYTHAAHALECISGAAQAVTSAPPSYSTL